jgi:hypothetical protein
MFDRYGLARASRRIVALCVALAGANALSGAANAQGTQVGDVFYIALENHNFTQPGSQSSPQQIFGNPAAPFINSLITPGNSNAAQVSYASAYHNVLSTPSGTNPSIHPSEPNYVWSEAGLAGPLNDTDPFPNNIVNAPNLRGLLQNAGISWKSYQEDIDLAKNGQGNLTNTVLPQNQWTVPLTSFNGTSSAYTNAYNGSNQYNFSPKHEGSLFFTATNGGNDPTPANPEAKYYAPMQQLQTDLANNTVARFNWITPDQFNDMHTPLTNGFSYHGVNYTGDAASIAQGDNFVSIVVSQILASQAYKNNGVIVIWNDETEGGDDFAHTSTEIVISPLAKGNAYTNSINYTHSSDLQTLQEIFGVNGPNGRFLGDANTPGTHDLSDLFVTGAIAPVPEPSPFVLCIVGAAGLGVVARLRRRRRSVSQSAGIVL